MRDHPGRNLKWLERQLLEEEDSFRDPGALSKMEYDNDEDLLELVDRLIGEDEEDEEEPPIRNFANNYGRTPRSVRAEQARRPTSFDESAAVLTKTKKQLRQEAKQQKIAEKKAGVNRKLGDLIFLAILECAGILAILGWWLQ